MITVVAALAALALLFLVQPFVLQFACATSGVTVPRLGRAVGVAVAAFVVGLGASAVWAVTGGLLFGLVHPALGVLTGLAFSALVASVVYSATLRVAWNQGARVAMVVQVVGWGLAALVGAGLWAVVAVAA